MTPLDTLERSFRARMDYHIECLQRPGEDIMFHIGNIHALSQAMHMITRVRPGEKYDE